MNGAQEDWWSDKEKIYGLDGQDPSEEESEILFSPGLKTLLAGGIVLVGCGLE